MARSAGDSISRTWPQVDLRSGADGFTVWFLPLVPTLPCDIRAGRLPEIRKKPVGSRRRWPTALLESPIEPGAGEGPGPVGRPGRQPEHLGGLFRRHPGEVAELHQLG